MVVAIPVALWAVSQPVTAAVLVAATVGLSIAVRRTAELVRCFYNCPALAFDFGGRVRVTVAQTPTDGSN